MKPQAIIDTIRGTYYCQVCLRRRWRWATESVCRKCAREGL